MKPAGRGIVVVSSVLVVVSVVNRLLVKVSVSTVPTVIVSSQNEYFFEII